jgi:hypothetical protein
MIRVRKSEDVPASLAVDNPTKYDSQDVLETLVANQDEKCYLCEQQHRQNFQVEHLKPKAVYRDLEFEWTNLFSACPYCNGRKPNSYDILDPSQHNLEEIIIQQLDLASNKSIVESQRPGLQEDFTVALLKRLFNGENSIRDLRSQILFDDLQREIVFFLKLLNDYKNDKSVDNKQKIIDALNIKKEYLAYKYWLIKNNEELNEDFKDYVIWNKLIH